MAHMHNSQGVLALQGVLTLCRWAVVMYMLVINRKFDTERLEPIHHVFNLPLILYILILGSNM